MEIEKVTQASLEEVRPRLMAFALHLGLKADDAEDHVQAVLLRAWRFRGKFDPAKSCLYTWTRRMLQHRVWDEWKRRRSEVSLDDPNFPVQDLYVEGPEPDGLSLFLQRLQPIERAMVDLWMDGESCETISKVLGVDVKRVYGVRDALRPEVARHLG